MKSQSLTLLIFILTIACVCSLGLGAVPLQISEVSRGLFGFGDPRVVTVMQEIRLPRMLLGLLIGAALGTSGAALQGLLRNPLAEPSVLGISASAAFGAVLVLYYGWAEAFPLALPLASMCAGAIGTLLLLIAVGREADGAILILAGIAVSSLATALTAFAINLAPDPFAMGEMVMWLMGSLRDRSLEDVALALPFVIVGLVLMHGARHGLDALILGEDTAVSLGVSLFRLRHRIILGSAFAVGATVAVAGTVGFVGLVVPHLMRPSVRYCPSALLLPSALGGALLVTLADIAVRLIPSEVELMLGVLTSIAGGLFFLLIIFKGHIV